MPAAHPPDNEPLHTQNALTRDEAGRPVETPGEMFRRVAANVAAGERLYAAGRDPDQTAGDFYRLMARLEFLPNSPTLMNAGRRLQQLAACFVLPVEDSIEAIFESIKNAAVIHQTGGGTGFSFSRLRPAGDLVSTSGGAASGPLSFMRVFNEATESVAQGGFRRGANMGVLRVDHPDVERFIAAKRDPTALNNFNISVAVTDAFMRAVEEDGEYDLVNPRTGRAVRRLRARAIFDAIVDVAWTNGEPGLIFLDRLNADNPTPALGPIESTNPCGEQPLLPYEACNLGSINVARFVRPAPTSPPLLRAREGVSGGAEVERPLDSLFDLPRLSAAVRLAVRFLDDVIDASRYPLPQIDAIVKGNRKIGLGVMGFADALIACGVPYDSEAALLIGEALMRFVGAEAQAASVELAAERGPFPNYGRSLFVARGGPPRRNATVTTIAPTGTLSIIAGCSSGIEPVFALSYVRNVLGGKRLLEVHPLFERAAKARGFYSPPLLDRLAANHGSSRGLPEVPPDLQRLFAVAYDIAPDWHVRMQAAFQKHTENAVSKTVNLPREATREDVARVYRLAYELNCKGVTVYRDATRHGQVLEAGAVPFEGAEDAEGRGRTPRRVCHDCGRPLHQAGPCYTCLACGYSTC
jgi:ribonucleoside-diphosphate reductase alpha chain